MSRFRKSVAVVLIALFSTQCVVRKRQFGQVMTAAPNVVQSPVRAHLKDGTTVIYENGVSVTTDALEGPGTAWDLRRTTSRSVSRVVLSDVIGVETFRATVDAGASVGASLLGVAVTIGIPALIVASSDTSNSLFGSCPTVYSGDGEEDEAELFSTSIAPLFEARDIDRLKARPDASGRLTLEIRNEALESHYINHLQLVEARHHVDEFVVPDTAGVPVAVAGLKNIPVAVNRRGRDVTAQFAASADGRFYETELDTLREATTSDLTDWIDLTVPVDSGALETALVFRLRNSLLNTILLYDVMLGRSGAKALDWMGKNLSRVSDAAELTRWHQEYGGLHVQVWQDGVYRTVARVPDAGPISWRDVAAILPVAPGQTSLRVRLVFAADHVRIDRLSAGNPRAIARRTIPLSQVIDSSGGAHVAALEGMAEPDTVHLQTSPGQRFFAHFETGLAPSSAGRTFFLGSQGYYTEWIRPKWILSATGSEPFVPSTQALLDAIRRWSGQRESFERQFFSSKVPIR